MTNLGEQITKEAWDAFDRFCKEIDPDGEIDILDKVELYGRRWSEQYQRTATAAFNGFLPVLIRNIEFLTRR